MMTAKLKTETLVLDWDFCEEVSPQAVIGFITSSLPFYSFVASVNRIRRLEVRFKRVKDFRNMETADDILYDAYVHYSPAKQLTYVLLRNQPLDYPENRRHNIPVIKEMPKEVTYVMVIVGRDAKEESVEMEKEIKKINGVVLAKRFMDEEETVKQSAPVVQPTQMSIFDDIVAVRKNVRRNMSEWPRLSEKTLASLYDFIRTNLYEQDEDEDEDKDEDKDKKYKYYTYIADNL